MPDTHASRSPPLTLGTSGTNGINATNTATPAGKLTPQSNAVTVKAGKATADITGSDLGNPRGYVDGQVYFLTYRDDLRRWTAYVRDSILEPAIGRDVLALATVRKPALLRQIFGVCASSPAQIVSLQKLQGHLQDSGALETIQHYLELLQDAFLIAPLPKHSTRAARQRAAPPKLVTLNNALLAVVDPQGIPDASTNSARYGAWVENACLAHAWNAGQNVTYWREEPLEVDGVIEGTWGAFALEVKTGSVAASDLHGLGEFTRRYPKYEPLVLCDEQSEVAAQRAGFRAMSWRRFLLEGPHAT